MGDLQGGALASMPRPLAAGNSLSAASKSAPLPVPRSNILCGGSAANRHSASSISNSLSGRGIRTSGVTRKSSPQNSFLPMIWAIGSDFRRRPTSAENSAGAVSCGNFNSSSARSICKHAPSAIPHRDGGFRKFRTATALPRAVPRRHQPSRLASRLASSSAISESINSPSALPSIISGSLCSVRLIR